MGGPSRPEEAQACDLSSRPGNEASRGATLNSMKADRIERAHNAPVALLAYNNCHRQTICVSIMTAHNNYILKILLRDPLTGTFQYPFGRCCS